MQEKPPSRAGMVEGIPQAAADAVEVFDAVWVRPEDALRSADQWNLPFPTQRHLELLSGFDSPEAVMDYVAGLSEVPRIEPRISVHENGGISVLLPGEGGYEAAEQ